ncbi:hypothetical protein H261_11734 [Paramagnetospirillum caucaseum]|uniref:Uncharacterized protein n=1 Tax=Paramagnetospirillum caucaseum TaxID=1244869 RepID=M2Z5W4_9PROT|nr:hypothetical protein [Paramagnetospirillum caucaseum]EME69705.1 hypothetical protein H261_11734 [Paramagnetospirillum caucaseum]
MSDTVTTGPSYRVQRRERYLRDIPEHEFRAAVLDYLLDGNSAALDAIREKIETIKVAIPKVAA